jgi:hypothetical protein
MLGKVNVLTTLSTRGVGVAEGKVVGTSVAVGGTLVAVDLAGAVGTEVAVAGMRVAVAGTGVGVGSGAQLTSTIKATSALSMILVLKNTVFPPSRTDLFCEQPIFGLYKHGH